MLLWHFEDMRGMMTIMLNKSYEELITIPTYIDRFKYLQIKNAIGKETFGYDRYLNQILYHSNEWKKFRRDIIIRDNGMDMGFDGYEIGSRIIVHHINPITIDDVRNHNPCVFDPNNVICVSHNTHNAIHYGDSELLFIELVERKPNDTSPWKKMEVTKIG